MTTDAGAAITGGRTALGIELGSTRIKAVLIGPDHAPLAVGSSRLGEPARGPAVDLLAGRRLGRGAAEPSRPWPRTCGARHGVELAGVGALGVSAMMHGYLAFDADGALLDAVPHLAQHEHRTGGRAAQRGVRRQHPAPVERRAPLPGDPGRRGARRSAATT